MQWQYLLYYNFKQTPMFLGVQQKNKDIDQVVSSQRRKESEDRGGRAPTEFKLVSMQRERIQTYIIKGQKLTSKNSTRSRAKESNTSIQKGEQSMSQSGLMIGQRSIRSTSGGGIDVLKAQKWTESQEMGTEARLCSEEDNHSPPKKGFNMYKNPSNRERVLKDLSSEGGDNLNIMTPRSTKPNPYDEIQSPAFEDELGKDTKNETGSQAQPKIVNNLKKSFMNSEHLRLDDSKESESSESSEFVMEREVGRKESLLSKNNALSASFISLNGSAMGIQRSGRQTLMQMPSQEIQGFGLTHSPQTPDNILNSSQQSSNQCPRTQNTIEIDHLDSSGCGSSNDCESSIMMSSQSSRNGQVIPIINGQPATFQAGDMYQKLTKNNTSYLQIKAIWVMDSKKSVVVDIRSEDSVSYLLRKIGEQMEENFEDFRGLRNSVAKHIFNPLISKKYIPTEGGLSSRKYTVTSQGAAELLKVADSDEKYLKEEAEVQNCLKNGDQVFFDIETLDLWLNTEIQLSLVNRTVLTGMAQFKINKHSTFGNLRKKLQVFGIKLWCHKNRAPQSKKSEEESQKDTDLHERLQLGQTVEIGKQNDEPEDEFATSGLLRHVHFDEMDDRKTFGNTVKFQENILEESTIIDTEMEMQKQRISTQINEEDTQHLLYSVENFELISMFMPKFEALAVRQTVGVEGAIATHYIPVNQNQSNLAVRTLARRNIPWTKKNTTSLADDHKLAAGATKQTVDSFNLSIIDDNVQVGMLFDYQNHVVLKMSFVPFMQLNLQQNIQKVDIEQLDGMNVEDYKISTDSLKMQFESYIKKTRMLNPFHSQMLQSSNSKVKSARQSVRFQSSGSSEAQKFGSHAQSSHQDDIVLQIQESELHPDEEEKVSQFYREKDPFHQKSRNFQDLDEIEEENKSVYGSNFGHATKSRGQIIQLARISNSQSYIVDDNDQETNTNIQTEIEEENGKQKYGLKALFEAQAEAQKIVETEQLDFSEINRNTSMSKRRSTIESKRLLGQSGNLQREELKILKQQFVANMQQNFEKVYIWQLQNIYKNLIKDVQACCIERQVIIRSQREEVQNQFNKSITFIRNASLELEQALVVLMDFVSKNPLEKQGQQKLSTQFTSHSPEFVRPNSYNHRPSEKTSKRSKSFVSSVQKTYMNSLKPGLEILQFDAKYQGVPQPDAKSRISSLSDNQDEIEASAFQPLLTDSGPFSSRPSSFLSKTRNLENNQNRSLNERSLEKEKEKVQTGRNRLSSNIISSLFKRKSKESVNDIERDRSPSERRARLVQKQTVSPSFNNRLELGGPQPRGSVAIRQSEMLDPSKSVTQSLLKSQSDNFHINSKQDSKVNRKTIDPVSSNERSTGFQDQFLGIFKKNKDPKLPSVKKKQKSQNLVKEESRKLSEFQGPLKTNQSSIPNGLIGSSPGRSYDGRRNMSADELITPQSLIQIVKILGQIQMLYNDHKEQKITKSIRTPNNNSIRTPKKNKLNKQFIGTVEAIIKDEKLPASPASFTPKKELDARLSKEEELVVNTDFKSPIDENNNIVTFEEFNNLKQPQIRKLNFRHTGQNLWQVTVQLQYLNQLRIGLVNIDKALDKKQEKHSTQNSNKFRNLFSNNTPDFTSSHPSRRSASWQVPLMGKANQMVNLVLNNDYMAYGGQLINNSEDQNMNEMQSGEYLGKRGGRLKNGSKMEQRQYLLNEHLMMKETPYNMQQFQTRIYQEKFIRKRKQLRRRLRIAFACLCFIVLVGALVYIAWYFQWPL